MQLVRHLLPSSLPPWLNDALSCLAVGFTVYGTQKLLMMVRLPDGSPLFPKEQAVVSWQTSPFRFLFIVSVFGLVAVAGCLAVVDALNDLVLHHGLK
jgi:hypothetical protein